MELCGGKNFVVFWLSFLFSFSDPCGCRFIRNVVVLNDEMMLALSLHVMADVVGVFCRYYIYYSQVPRSQYQYVSNHIKMKFDAFEKMAMLAISCGDVMLVVGCERMARDERNSSDYLVIIFFIFFFCCRCFHEYMLRWYTLCEIDSDS